MGLNSMNDLIAIKVAVLISDHLRSSGVVTTHQAQFLFDALATAMQELSTQDLLDYLTLHGGAGDGGRNQPPR